MATMTQQEVTSRYTEIRATGKEYYGALQALMQEGATIDQAVQAHADFLGASVPVQPLKLSGRHAESQTKAGRAYDRAFERHHYGE